MKNIVSSPLSRFFFASSRLHQCGVYTVCTYVYPLSYLVNGVGSKVYLHYARLDRIMWRASVSLCG